MKVAVIDIGSNSIKLLVAEKQDEIRTLTLASTEFRIGDGLGQDTPFLFPEDTITNAIDVINGLLDTALRYTPQIIRIVATSAVRDAQNAKQLKARLYRKTGYTLEILSGEEELRFIAQGINVDPAARDIKSFSFFDLGGGSLEIAHVYDGKIVTGKSFQLGAIRLLENYIKDPQGVILKEELYDIRKHVLNVLAAENFVIPSVPLIGLGGVLSISRSLFAEEHHKSFEEENPWLETSDLNNLLQSLSTRNSKERIEAKKIPPGRADIMPVALQIVLTLTEAAQQTRILHSIYNLRYGIAASIFS